MAVRRVGRTVPDMTEQHNLQACLAADLRVGQWTMHTGHRRRHKSWHEVVGISPGTRVVTAVLRRPQDGHIEEARWRNPSWLAVADHRPEPPATLAQVRRALKASQPLTEFETWAAEGEVHVQWCDGPSTAEVAHPLRDLGPVMPSLWRRRSPLHIACAVLRAARERDGDCDNIGLRVAQLSHRPANEFTERENHVARLLLELGDVDLFGSEYAISRALIDVGLEALLAAAGAGEEPFRRLCERCCAPPTVKVLLATSRPEWLCAACFDRCAADSPTIVGVT